MVDAGGAGESAEGQALLSQEARKLIGKRTVLSVREGAPLPQYGRKTGRGGSAQDVTDGGRRR